MKRKTTTMKTPSKKTLLTVIVAAVIVAGLSLWASNCFAQTNAYVVTVANARSYAANDTCPVFQIPDFGLNVAIQFKDSVNVQIFFDYKLSAAAIWQTDSLVGDSTNSTVAAGWYHVYSLRSGTTNSIPGGDNGRIRVIRKSTKNGVTTPIWYAWLRGDNIYNGDTTAAAGNSSTTDSLKSFNKALYALITGHVDSARASAQTDSLKSFNKAVYALLSAVLKNADSTGILNHVAAIYSTIISPIFSGFFTGGSSIRGTHSFTGAAALDTVVVPGLLSTDFVYVSLKKQTAVGAEVPTGFPGSHGDTLFISRAATTTSGLSYNYWISR